MPLFYYARQSSLATKEGAKLWHLSLKKVERAVDAQQLAEVIAEKSSLTPGDVHNVLKTVDIRSPKTVISVHFSSSKPMAMQIY